jgi:hypothetical protein
MQRMRTSCISSRPVRGADTDDPHHHDGKSASPETQGAQPSASSTPAADQPKANSGNGFASRGLRTVGSLAFEGRRESLNQANKLSRTYATLLEALNRHHGGPAGGGELSKSKDQPYAPGKEIFAQTCMASSGRRSLLHVNTSDARRHPR